MIELVSDDTGRAAAVIEKDYYVTLVLRLLSEQLSNVVFKGGTSLSKGYHVINCFSEDIDITFDEHIGEARRKKLKNQILKGISEELCMPISNWENTQSDRDYNAYYTVSLALYVARNFYQIYRELPGGKGFADLIFVPRKKNTAEVWKNIREIFCS